MIASRAFRRRLEELDALVEFTSEVFALERIDPALRATVDLVLEELFTNVVKYGRKSDAAVRVEVSRVPGGVEATLIEEDADRFDPTAAPNANTGRPIAERVPGGLGLHLVRKLVDSMEYRYVEERRQGRTTFRKLLAGATARKDEDALD